MKSTVILLQVSFPNAPTYILGIFSENELAERRQIEYYSEFKARFSETTANQLHFQFTDLSLNKATRLESV